MERVKDISHKGQSIIIIDLSHTATTEQQVAIVNQAEKMIKTRPHRSIRLLIDYTDARFDIISIEASKNISADVTPYMKTCAVLGFRGVKKLFLHCVVGVIGRNIKTFKNMEAAMDWLAG